MRNLVLSNCSAEPSHEHTGREVVEMPLLLPTWLLNALEDAAHARGLTAASMIRHLLNEFMSQEASST